MDQGLRKIKQQLPGKRRFNTALGSVILEGENSSFCDIEHTV